MLFIRDSMVPSAERTKDSVHWVVREKSFVPNSEEATGGGVRYLWGCEQKRKEVHLLYQDRYLQVIGTAVVDFQRPAGTKGNKKSHSQIVLTCFTCGRANHLVRDCPKSVGPVEVAARNPNLYRKQNVHDPCGAVLFELAYRSGDQTCNSDGETTSSSAEHDKSPRKHDMIIGSAI